MLGLGLSIAASVVLVCSLMLPMGASSSGESAPQFGHAASFAMRGTLQ
jgi:hypothetical protein